MRIALAGSMERALAEMERRRTIQEAYNVEHAILPQSIRKSVDQVRFVTRVADARAERRPAEAPVTPAPTLERDELIAVLEQQMREAAPELDFELAAQLRDQLFDLRAAGDAPRRSPPGAGAGATAGASAGRHRAGAGGRRRRG